MHAYDDAAVIAGQGTIGLELHADTPELTHVLVSVGGGGLMAGAAAALEGRVQVVAVEPAGCPTLHAALAAGRPVAVETGGLAADSLGARTIGQLGFEIARRTGVESVLVDDAAIPTGAGILVGAAESGFGARWRRSDGGIVGRGMVAACGKPGLRYPLRGEYRSGKDACKLVLI